MNLAIASPLGRLALQKFPRNHSTQLCDQVQAEDTEGIGSRSRNKSAMSASIYAREGCYRLMSKVLMAIGSIGIPAS